MDALTEAYLEQLLAEAPPLSSEQAALVVRTFACKTTEPIACSDAA
jgi:hypothetical protein